MFTQKSFIKKVSDEKWYHIDAKDLVVGRVATKIANLLRGKNKPTYTPNMDSGDFVVVTNCEKVSFTGNKWDKKIYYKHSGYIGGLKERTANEQRDRHPELILFNAVRGMLPKGPLGRKQIKKLKLYAGDVHPHTAQNPETINNK